jgi:hypothetical protein
MMCECIVRRRIMTCCRVRTGIMVMICHSSEFDEAEDVGRILEMVFLKNPFSLVLSHFAARLRLCI